MGRLTDEADPVLGLADLMLLGVNRDGGAHFLHSLFSVLIRPYDPDQRLFRCSGDLPPKGLPRSPISRWIPLGKGALSALCPRMTTRCICRESPPLSGRRSHARGRSAREMDRASPDRDSPSSLQMPPGHFSIWKGVSARFQNKSFLCWPIKSLLTRRPSTAFILPSRATPKVSMWRQTILPLPSCSLWRGSLCFFWRSSASKPSTPGPTPGVIHLCKRVWKF